MRGTHPPAEASIWKGIVASAVLHAAAAFVLVFWARHPQPPPNAIPVDVVFLEEIVPGPPAEPSPEEELALLPDDTSEAAFEEEVEAVEPELPAEQEPLPPDELPVEDDVEPETPVTEEVPPEPDIPEPQVAEPEVLEPEVAEPEIVQPLPEEAPPEVAQLEEIVEPEPEALLEPEVAQPAPALQQEPPQTLVALPPPPPPKPQRLQLPEAPARPSTEAPVEEPPATTNEAPASDVALVRLNPAELRDDLISAIQRQVQRCWKPERDAREDRSLSIKIDVALKRDGSLQRADVVEVGRMVRDDLFRSAATDAHRAVQDCSPFSLPVEQFAYWSNMTLRFRPHCPRGDCAVR